MPDKRLEENIKRFCKIISNSMITLSEYRTSNIRIRDWNTVAKFNMSLNIRRVA